MRWRATAARPIPFANPSSGCARTIPQKFLESFYFQYGHASIADLGHVVLCFEGISELAATEIEDEQLWDGQARSLRAIRISQNPDSSRRRNLTPRKQPLYQEAAANLLSGYNQIHARVSEYLTEQLPRPDVDEAGSVQAQYRGARFRCCALSVVFRHSHRRGTSHQHSHAGTPDPAAEDFRVCGTSRAGRRNRGSLFRAAAVPVGAKRVNGSIGANSGAARGTRTSIWRSSRENLRLWARQNLPPRTQTTDSS